MKSPMQRVVRADDGMIRFEANPLVQHLLDAGGLDLNDLAEALPNVGGRHWEQLAQLIGYSVDGYSTLSYVSDKSWKRAEKRAEKLRTRKESECSI